ncbi:Gfo/Idh/MocA family protein [Merismopedia glauca]|uniref:Glycosyl transferase family 2 n=1 Tax=Merismopedia glauca CCAP 1448/3 TaxID=1296344 RepID=A0A2T1C8W5_9CYAN|nr:Gfo/Idh/MocA family oxidoreductase [Merismopedia glauca]PSB04710.1 glycosyl transferase family 2 [Merismopedia glauca CCAP 1448/3]
MSSLSEQVNSQVLGVGLVGTGYVSKLRSETFSADERSRVVAVNGRSPEKTEEFSQNCRAKPISSAQELVARADVDLVVLANINCDRYEIGKAALNAGKHLIVEYPLALDLREAEHLMALAAERGKLLHVEHIELLGGLHQGLKENLAHIGKPFYAKYSTIAPQHPAPRKWTYNHKLFGFPLMGALSRVHRAIDLLGEVASVSCQAQYWDVDGGFYTACLCTAQLKFTSGLVAEITYGKGETFWEGVNRFEICGEQGKIVFDGDRGTLFQKAEQTDIQLGSRRGLFAKDTTMILDYLTDGTPLYVKPEASFYALKVADAARISAESGKTVFL